MIKNIIIDFDNTIANSSETAFNYFCDKYKALDPSISYDPSILLWNFQPFIKNECQLKDVLEYMNSESFFNQVGVLKGVREVLYKLKENSLKLTLCTNRSGRSFDYVKDWLKSFDLYKVFDYIVCVSSFDKSIINGEIIIDDKPSCMINDNRQAHIIFGNFKYAKDEFIDNFNSIKDPKSYKFCENWHDVLAAITNILIIDNAQMSSGGI